MLRLLWDSLRLERRDGAMVRWYEVPLLLRMKLVEVVARRLGRWSDPRLGMSNETRPVFHDLRSGEVRTVDLDSPMLALEAAPGRPLAFDYIADTGDGFDSTYAVIRASSRRDLRLGLSEPLPDASTLVLGGDLVYPTAGRAEYRRRLLRPFHHAATRPDALKHRDVFAIPGNHDWYDGLRIFRRLFCEGEELVGPPALSWRTYQRRSYFALRLPMGYWLLACDFQLDGDIDARQLEYFESLLSSPHFGVDDRVILALPSPVWQRARQGAQSRRRRFPDARFRPRVDQLMGAVIGPKLALAIAGDNHHYFRYANDDGSVQAVTAGGGGAHLHPTSHFRLDATLPQGDGDIKLEARAAYPDASTSRKLGFGNVFFFIRNPNFGLLMALVYCVVGAPVLLTVHATGGFDLGAALTRLLAFVDPLLSGAWLLAIALFLWSYASFTTSTNALTPTRRRVIGLAHGLTQLSVALLLTRCAVPVYRDGLLSLLALAAGGWVLGSAVFGLYLTLAFQCFGLHPHEAFSALRIADFKSFVRAEVSDDGGLRVWVVGIERVPRSGLRGRPPSEAEPHLVDAFEVPRTKGARKAHA